MKRVKVELEDLDGNVYVVPSLVYAREYLGITRSQMDEICDRNIRIDGFVVRRSSAVQTNEGDLPRYRDGLKGRKIRQEVVAWKEDGRAVKFASVTEAARVAKCREVTIRQAMRRAAKAGGWFWEYAKDSSRNYEIWYPGMEVSFKFRLNAKVEGYVPKKRPDHCIKTLEEQEWARVGCKNALQYREYLSRTMWEEMTPPLVEKDEDDYGIF